MKKIVGFLISLCVSLLLCSPAFASYTCSPFIIEQHLTNFSPNVTTVGGNSINVRNATKGETIAHLILHIAGPGCTDTLSSIREVLIGLDRSKFNQPSQQVTLDFTNLNANGVLIDTKNQGSVGNTGPLDASVDIPIIYNGVGGNGVIISLDYFNDENNYYAGIYASGSGGSSNAHAFALAITPHSPLVLFETSPGCAASVDDINFGDVQVENIIQKNKTKTATLRFSCGTTAKNAPITLAYFSFSGTLGEDITKPGVIKSSNNKVGFEVSWGDNAIGQQGTPLPFHKSNDLPISLKNVMNNPGKAKIEIPFDVTPVYLGNMNGSDISGAVTAGLVITIGYL